MRIVKLLLFTKILSPCGGNNIDEACCCIGNCGALPRRFLRARALPWTHITPAPCQRVIQSRVAQASTPVISGRLCDFLRVFLSAIRSCLMHLESVSMPWHPTGGSPRSLLSVMHTRPSREGCPISLSLHAHQEETLPVPPKKAQKSSLRALRE